MAQTVLNKLVCGVESVLPDRRSCGHLDASLMMSAVQLGWGQVGRERQVRLLCALRVRTAGVRTVKTTRSGSVWDQGDNQQLQTQQTEKMKSQRPG